MSQYPPGYIPLTNHHADTYYAPILPAEPKCSYCGKKRFVTRAVAAKWLLDNASVNKFNIYHCDDCEQFHLATKQEFKTNALIRRRR